MSGYVDLNADVGASDTDDVGVLSVVTSANVSCGAHSGTDETIRAACAEAVRHGVTIGALVSYVDRRNRGLVLRDTDPDLLTEQIADQIGALSEVVRSEGGFVTYIKAHGALYHRTVADEGHANAVLAGSGRLPILGTPGSLLLRLAGESGRRVRHEGFPDRAYTSEGALVPPDQPGAVLEEPGEIADRALALAASMDSLCVHGEGAQALARAIAIRDSLCEHGWNVRTCWLSTASLK